MPQVETLPQSIADIRTIVLKPRLDLGDLGLIGEKIKPSLFARFGFKSKPEDVRLLVSETYYEPYLVIAGKYVLDYCRKHVFEVNVKETTTKIFVAGQEFRSEQSDPKVSNKVVKMVGEEYAHHERHSYYVLDRMKREVPPEKLPISPFIIQKEKLVPHFSFKSINIPDEIQIEFLKKKIAQRPADVAEIIKEVFDITDRTIAYYPMYQLIFENVKDRRDATVTIDSITGEVILNGAKKLAVKTVVAFDESAETQSARSIAYEEKIIETAPNVKPSEIADKSKTLSKEGEPIQQKQPLETARIVETQTETTGTTRTPETKYNTRTTPEEEAPSKMNKTAKATTPEETKTKVDINVSPPSPKGSKKTTTRDGADQPNQLEVEEKTDYEENMILGFTAKISGEVFSVGDNITAIVGNIEVPSSTKINKTLVVKGSLKLGDNCRVRGKLKALRNIILGANTIIDGDVVSGGNVLVGPGTLITGRLQAGGYIKIGKQATIESGLRPDPATDTTNDIQLEVGIGDTFASVAHET